MDVDRRILGSLRNKHVVQLIDKIMDMQQLRCYIIMEVSFATSSRHVPVVDVVLIWTLIYFLPLAISVLLLTALIDP